MKKCIAKGDESVVEIDFIELMLIEKLGKVLAYAVRERKYNRYELIEKWLSSETFYDAVTFDVSLSSQALTYILSRLEKEYEGNLPTIDEHSPLYEDDLFWFGYVVAYWFFLDGTTGKEMLQKYDMKHSLDGYDVLHTLSVRTAIEKIKEDDAL